MSLINEALKKAQSQQDPAKTSARKAGTGSTVTQAMGRRSPHVPAVPAPRSSLLLPVLAGGAILAVLVLGIGLIFWSLNRPSDTGSEIARAEPSAMPQPPPPTSPDTTGAAAAAVEDAVAPTEAPAEPAQSPPPVPLQRPNTEDPPDVSDSEPVLSVEPAPPLEQPTRQPAPPDAASPTAAQQRESVPTAAEGAEAPEAVAETAPAPAPPEPEATPPAADLPPVPAPFPEAQILEVIDQLEIRGIMADSRRVLIYDSRVKRSFAYGLDSTVSGNPFLKIKDITSSSIIFTDDAGRSFTKSF
ncbi:MAG: hypothetical protein JJU00_13750 [Opitutales bacterium]|nr:hypothetical protein [Opitutales bacterium]